MTTPADLALVTDRATNTAAYVPANRLAVAPATFNILCRESSVEWMRGSGAPGNDQIHITTGTDDADELDELDDLLRERAQTVSAFDGGRAWVLFPKGGIDGCDVWALSSIEVVSAEDAAEMGA